MTLKRRWRGWLLSTALSTAAVCWLAGASPAERPASQTIASIALTSDAGGRALFPGVSLAPGHPATACIQVDRSFTGGEVYVGMDGGSGALLDYLQVTVKMGAGGVFGSCSRFQGATVYTGPLVGLETKGASGATGAITGWSSPSVRTRSFEVTVFVLGTNAAQDSQASGTFVWTLLAQPSAATTTPATARATPTPASAGTGTPGTTSSAGQGSPSTARPAQTPPAKPGTSTATTSAAPSGTPSGHPGEVAHRSRPAGTGPATKAPSGPVTATTRSLHPRRPHRAGQHAHSSPRPLRPRSKRHARPATRERLPGPARTNRRPHSKGGPASPPKRPALGLNMVVDTARQIAGQARLPVTLFAILAAFLFLQGRLDRRDPKLALAPLGPEPSLPFDPASGPSRWRARRHPTKKDNVNGA